MGKARAPVARRHHVVPDFYLRRFADDSGRVLVVMRNGQSFPTSTKNVAVDSNLYTIDESNDPDELERFLSEVETRSSQALERLATGSFPPSVEDREVVGVFIALQYARTRALRDAAGAAVVQDLKRSVKRMTLDEIRASVSGHVPDADDPDELARTIFRDFQGYSIVPSSNVPLLMMFLFAVYGVLPELLRRSWHVSRIGRKRFITSDHPVAWRSSRIHKAPSAGTLVDSDEVLFPLDPTHLLVLRAARTTETLTDVGSRWAERANQCIATFCERMIIGPPDGVAVGRVHLLTQESRPPMVLPRWLVPEVQRIFAESASARAAR